MPTRASALTERRRREALERAALRRERRRALAQIFLVTALTAPVIAAAVFDDMAAGTARTAEPTDGPDRVAGPTDASPAPDETAVGGSRTDASATPAPSSPRTPAPRQVRRLASDHGGSPASRWIADGCDEVAELVRRNGMPEWMTTVAWRESRCRHGVTNFDHRTADQSYGLFQINVLGDLWRESRDRCGLERPEELLDPHVNVACAAALYRAYGYRPWDSGRYFSG